MACPMDALMAADHDPLAEALEEAGVASDLFNATSDAAAIHDALDAAGYEVRPKDSNSYDAYRHAKQLQAEVERLRELADKGVDDDAGYEVRPKLTVERLAAALMATMPVTLREVWHDESARKTAAAILQALEGEP